MVTSYIDYCLNNKPLNKNCIPFYQICNSIKPKINYDNVTIDNVYLITCCVFNDNVVNYGRLSAVFACYGYLAVQSPKTNRKKCINLLTKLITTKITPIIYPKMLLTTQHVV